MNMGTRTTQRPTAWRRPSTVLASFLLGSALGLAAPAYAGPFIDQTNLVTDDQTVLTSLGYAPAANVDINLVNPWGISHTATSPFWVSDNGADVSTLYNSIGQPFPVSPPGTPLVVPVTLPTGQVSNIGGANDFKIGGTRAGFIFATENGTIVGRTVGTTAITAVTTPGAVYKGLAIGNSGSGFVLYAANFNSGKIDVFDSSFAPATLSGNFTDPSPPPVPPGTPAGQTYAPFNVQVLNNKLYVTYALQDAARHDDVAGAGNGFVDEFDLNGNFITRVATNGPLDSPWGLDIAPAGFLGFANDLLIGNFGDGLIDVYSPTNQFLGQLEDGLGNPIVIDGLWALINGNGGNGGDPNLVYFTAGIDGENHGLFGSLTAVPEPGTLALFGAGLLSLGALCRRHKAKT